MQPPIADTEAAALAAVYHLLRDLGKRRLASQANENSAAHPDCGDMMPTPEREVGDAREAKTQGDAGPLTFEEG